jgi:hypothetical protein
MCRGCGTLLFANRNCTPCDTATIHVITDMGPTGGPGRIVHAQLLGSQRERDFRHDYFDRPTFHQHPPPPRRPSPPDDPYRFTKTRPE